jgi:hypothetical protein
MASTINSSYADDNQSKTKTLGNENSSNNTSTGGF